VVDRIEGKNGVQLTLPADARDSAGRLNHNLNKYAESVRNIECPTPEQYEKEFDETAPLPTFIPKPDYLENPPYKELGLKWHK
jgi:hypothetical protein